MKLRSITLFSILLLASFSAAAQNNKDSAKVDDRVFTRVEQEAEFPGGLEGWKKFLIKNLNAEVPGENGAPAGMYTIIARFIVKKDGILDNIELENSQGYGMDKEVIRVITKSGKWVPAVQNGRNVNAYRRQPITFAVFTDAFDLTTVTPFTFYTGVENELTVTADKVKPENIDVTISKGSIKQIAEGKYIVKVDKPGRVIIEVFNTKKNKSLGTASFEVKPAK
jgi:GldM C-terminal domain/Gram-negative bacterial TonB protein C-terminal